MSRPLSEFAIRRVRNRVHIALLLLVVLALVLRAASYLENPRPFAGGGLAAAQAEMARNIVDRGRWFVTNRKATDLVTKRQIQEHRLIDFSRIDFSHVDRVSRAEPTVDQMPGVSVVLAGLWWVGGTRTYTSLEWLQILIDTAMVLLVYWIASRLTQSRRVSLLSAFLYAVWPGAIIVAKRPVLDTWAVFFTIGCVAAFVWARERPTSRRRLALLGAVSGVGIYFRPFIVLIPIALALVATPRGGWKRRLVWLTAPTVIALLILAPWTIRNYYDFHRFIPTRTGLGQAVFEGIGQTSSDQGASRYVHHFHQRAAYGSPAYDDFLLSGAVRAIAKRPGYYLGLVGRRAVRLLPCLLLLVAWWRWRRAALIPVAAAASVIVPYLFIGDDTRFYLPAAFAYFILMSMALEASIGPFRRVARYFSSRLWKARRSSAAVQPRRALR